MRSAGTVLLVVMLVLPGALCACAAPSASEARTSSSVANAVTAEIAKPAPDFTLSDLDGKSVSLHDLRGKTVVLEWFNPDCPFVRMSHTKGSLVGTAKRHTDRGVVWLAINSAAPGKQGSAPERNLEAKTKYGMSHPILLDPAGDVGRSFGATNTPHMIIIDPQGVLVYHGAIDNSPDGEGESPTDGKLVNYVDATLDALDEGRPVAVKETRAYGCSVKYAK